LIDVFLEEAGPAYAIRVPVQYHWPIAKIGQDHIGYLVVIANDVTLRETLLGPENLVEMSEVPRWPLPTPDPTLLLYWRLTRFGRSRINCVADLSVRRPRNTGWRIRPSFVHSVNLTSATSRGRTHVVERSFGILPLTGFHALCSFTSLAWIALRLSSLKPVPV
jgi:hypothetical protein